MDSLWSYVALTLVLTLTLTCVNSTSDPAARVCETVCWDENALAEQCMDAAGCDAGSMSDEELTSCGRPCWRDVSACQRLCRTHFEVVLDRCQSPCNDSSSPDCIWDCFVDWMLRKKARLLRSNRHIMQQNNKKKRVAK